MADDKSQTRHRHDNELRTYIDIDGDTFVKVTDGSLNEKLDILNSTQAEMVKELKRLNMYFALITNTRI
jgi:hypothetical protein